MRRFSFSKIVSDLRKRRRSALPEPAELRAQYDEFRAELKPLLPRRGRDGLIPQANLEQIQRSYPELGWSDRRDSLQVTPASAARKILASKYGVKESYVRRRLEGTS